MPVYKILIQYTNLFKRYQTETIFRTGRTDVWIVRCMDRGDTIDLFNVIVFIRVTDNNVMSHDQKLWMAKTFPFH